MYQMSQNGISNKDITDYLNEHKIQPKRTEKYTTKLVWSILKKYRLKLERQKCVEVRYENIGLYKRV
jgi:arginine/lysine/ornithine decarboxylase